MKKARISMLFLIAGILQGQQVFAQSLQWNGPNDQTNSIGRTGSVGIGTTSPGTEIHINGTDDIFTISSNNADSGVKGNWKDFPQIVFPRSTSYTYTGAIGAGIQQGYSGLMNFYVSANSDVRNASNIRMTINQSGNVGIGTTTPKTKLHILGNVSGGNPYMDSYPDGRLTVEHANRASVQLLSGNTGDQYIQFGDTEDANRGFVAYTHNDDIMHFKAGGISTMYIKNGNIGIGTTSPSEKLTVSGGSIKIDYGQALRGGTSGNWLLGQDAGTNLIHIGSAVTANDIRFDSNNGSIFLIKSTGEVGIGMTSPSEKLSVNGKIRTKEIIVTETGWSDYVFEDNYVLMPLEKVEEHIQAEKHLPDIPSAQEVEVNGVSLGEMQAKLLKKIEELTLYAIEQQKQIKSLKLQMEEMKKGK